MAKCDGVVCCFGCMSLIPGFTEHVVDKLAFFPPKPPGYYIDGDGKLFVLGEGELDGEGLLEALPDFSTEGIQVAPVTMHTSRGSTIYGVHFRRLDATKTVLFSHGNSADCGSSFVPCLELCRELRVNVLVYDYTGYGLSSGTPSEKDMYADIDAARNYLTQDCGEPLDSIVCYGQSLGSVPSIDLASRCCLGGVILHSALASGLRVIHEDLQTTPWFDIFKNVVKIADVQCPVFVIHGNQDLEVPIEHGRALHEACPPRFAAEPWWVQEAGHHDIETHWRSMYLRKLQLFLRSLAPVEQEDSEGQPFT